MYHAHFSLREEPFGVSPDHRFFLPTDQHRNALLKLYQGIKERRGFALLVGNAGLGKTSVLVKLLQILKTEKAETVYLPHPYFDRKTVLEAILISLHVEVSTSLAENFRRLQDYLAQTHAAGKICVVAFDEAHELTPDTLETIRMLSNAETPSEKLIQIVLAGQMRLADTLKQPQFEQLRQRLGAVVRLEPLNRSEVGGYLAHRLKMAGSERGLFVPEAVEAIATGSAGVPRNINTLSYNSLSLAYTLNHEHVLREDVEQVLRDLDLNLRDFKTAEPVAARGPVPEPSRETALVRFSPPRELPPEASPRLRALSGFLSVRSNLLAVVAASLFLLLSWFTGMIMSNN